MYIDSLNYYIKIFNILDSSQITINDANLNQSVSAPYILEEIDVTNNIFNPSDNIATIRLSYFELVNSTAVITPAIYTGNVIQIFEAVNNEIGTCIFVGYISSFDLQQSTRDSGTLILLNCESILNQLNIQAVVDSKEDILTLLGTGAPITNFFQNKVVFGNILSFMTRQSLLGFAARNNIVNSPSTFNGVQLPFNIVDTAGVGFSIDSPVFYFASTNDSRLASLLRTINAYQMILYQQLDGTLIITQPNIGKNNNGYYFTVGQYGKSLSANSLLYKSFHYSNKAASIANHTYASLINVGLNITGANDQNNINYSSNISGSLFPRVSELRNSGIFELTKHDIIDMTGSMLTDPLLLNVLQKSGKNKSLIINNVSGISSQTTAAGIYANQLLAQELFHETQLTITLARGACVSTTNTLLPIPFGQMVQCADNGSLGFNTDQYYCYEFNLNSNAESGTNLTLKMTKPYTNVSVWTNI